MANPSELANWLESLPHVHEVVPGFLTWSKISYPAARYKRTMTAPEGSIAYSAGEREYVQEFIYALGMLPRSYCRSSRVALHVMGDMNDDWFVCCYSGLITKRVQAVQEVSEGQPFGNMFMLSPWSVPDGCAIDEYERTPYRRERVTFTLT